MSNIDLEQNIRDISYKQEVFRKLIHLGSLVFPICYVFTEKSNLMIFIVPLMTLVVILDILSQMKTSVRLIVHKYFGKMMRQHELQGDFTLNGASWVLISATLCFFIFPKIIAITAFSILIISDICAALIGKRFGKNPLFNKSMEGTTAFAISAFLVVLIIGSVLNAPWTYVFFGFFASVFSGLVEAASKMLRIDDNLSIPFSVGLLLWGGGLVAANFLNEPFLMIF